jgi:hypothetical protein
MTKLLILAFAGTLFLSGCGIDGEPLTPPAKTTS